MTVHASSWRPRAIAVVVASAAALVAWSIIELGLGLDLRGPAFAEGMAPMDVGPFEVLFGSALGGLAGWGLLALFERVWSSRGRRVWLIVAGVALPLSLGPLSGGSGVNVATRIGLMVLHLVTGGVLMTLLYRSARHHRDEDAA